MELDKFRNVDLVVNHVNDNFFFKQFVSQNDNDGRTLTVQIAPDGVAGKVQGLDVNLKWSNQASGLTDLSAFECIDESNSVFQITYPKNMLNPGKVVASIQIIQNGKVSHSKQFEITVQRLAGESKGIISKAEYSALVSALADANKFKTDIEKLDNEKADSADLANTNKNLTDLKNKKVDKGGASQVTWGMIAQDAREQISGGKTAVVGENVIGDVNVITDSIPISKIAKKYNMISGFDKVNDAYPAGIDTNNKPLFTTQTDYMTVKIAIPETGKLTINRLSIDRGQYIIAVDENDKVIFRQTQSEFPNLNRAGYSIKSTTWEINCEAVTSLYPERFIYLSILKSNKSVAYVYGENVVDVTDYAFLAEQSEPDLSIDQVSNNFYSGANKIIYKYRQLAGFAPDTKLVDFYKITSNCVLELSNLPKIGKLRLTKPTITAGQVFVLEGEGGICYSNVYVSSLINNSLPSYATVENDALTIDLAKIDPENKLVKLYVGFTMNDYESLRVEFLETRDLYEVLKWAKPISNNLTDENFNLPDYVPIVTGKETYLYFDNLLIDKNTYAQPFPIITNNQLEDKAVINTTADYSHTINFAGTSKSVSIKSVPVDATSNTALTAMIVGESTSEAMDYRTALKGFFDEDNQEINFVGTRKSSSADHEARSGWGAGTLRYVQEANNATNSFWNPETGTFDLDYYFAQNPTIPVPDIIFLNFGINDVNRYVTDGRGGTQTDHYQFFIDEFKKKNPNVIAIVGLSHSFNRWANNWNVVSRDVIMKRTKQTNTDFKNREAENIFLNPWYVCMDMRWDFGYQEIPSNQFSSHMAIKSTDTVHPAKSGYQNMALMSYFALKYAIAKMFN